MSKRRKISSHQRRQKDQKQYITKTYDFINELWRDLVQLFETGLCVEQCIKSTDVSEFDGLTLDTASEYEDQTERGILSLFEGFSLCLRDSLCV